MTPPGARRSVPLVPQHDDGPEGLFGPGSVTWRLHAEPLMGVAGLRALLLQALHPVGVAAVDDHSSYREDTWGRLNRTAQYIGVITYGSRMEALVAGARVRAIHDRVRGQLPDGRPYSANDPDLLVWVHCGLVASVLDVLGRAGVPLTDQERDRYVAEQVRAAALVGLEPDQVPDSAAGLERYYQQVRPALRGTAAARSAALVVVAPPMPLTVALATPARPAWASVAGLAYASLPTWARRMYALPELPGAASLHEAGTTVALRALRTTLRGVQALVPAVREGPHLKQARARLALATPVASLAPARPGGDQD
jgi:uncharacterized protein (DUF2236 family)